MRNKSILMILALLILACSITAVAAESASVGDYTFEIPEGYAVNETAGNQCVLTQDDNHVIVVIIADSISNSDDVIKNLEAKGYKFIGENTYNADGYDVHQQNYEMNDLTVYSYNFELNDGKYCIITYTIPSSEQVGENEDNPITGILNSIE
ncbi:hypothetical protein [Methanobrevibacter sp.]|uniref:hypothetical protein n=1 Tax=Methanobrevibacter sp. TaxID=66852 RepID=UPI00270F5886|nr:hypothetical protein [Methanobrevibacter sp.]